MARRQSLLALCAVLLFASPAHAASRDEAGKFVAERTWGTPSCGTPSVESSTPKAYQAAHGSGYFESDPIAWADENRCVIVINADATIRTAAKRCHVIVHEWGHLAGRAHSKNPRSVMYEEDMVSESVLHSKGKRRWTASGAFAPCVDVTRPGASFG